MERKAQTWTERLERQARFSQVELVRQLVEERRLIDEVLAFTTRAEHAREAANRGLLHFQLCTDI